MSEISLKKSAPYPLLDIVGTGGDGLHTINISTGSALLAASCGVKIAKHGNRSASSLSGSADVIEKLGININASVDNISAGIDQFNFGFFYAPHFHPALGNIKSIRKKLGIPTVFNLIGPLLNPADAEQLMISIADPRYLDPMAEVLLKRGVKRALVFHGQGLDEISCCGPIDMIEINQATIQKYTLNATDYGLNTCSIESLQGGTPAENAAVLKRTLQGETGPIANTLILNAGMACYLHGISPSKQEGVDLAQQKHASGCAYKLILALAAHSHDRTLPQESSHA